MTFSLRQMRRGREVAHILSAALQAVEAQSAVRHHLKRDGEQLILERQVYDLSRIERVFLVGAGKAGQPMALAAADLLGERLSGACIIVKEGYLSSEAAREAPQIEFIEAGHPVPDMRGVRGAQRLQRLLTDTREEDLVICVISGGGSALLASPAKGIRLGELQELTSALLASGADIYEINTVRKHLENLKGGGLAQLASPARVVTLILSDVIGNSLEAIASGPTAPDPTTFQQAYAVLEKYGLLSQTPDAILRRLQLGVRGEIPETPKPGDALFRHVDNMIIADNSIAARAAMQAARELGFNSTLLTTYLQGEARQAGKVLASLARQMAASGEPLPRPACLIVGGETTVTLRGNGMGGRNQELALGALRDIAGLREVALVALATDGGDGPTDAAGAVVTGESLSRALELGLQPEEYLRENNAYPFFEKLGDLIKTGPTFTNVNDLVFLFAF